MPNRKLVSSPASPNPACRFPALGFLVCFTPKLMGPISPERLSAERAEPDSRETAVGFRTPVPASTRASRDPLNPLAPPGRCLEGIREILCLVHDLTVAELHNAHCVGWSPLVGDCVFRDPEITFSENSLDVEA